MAYDETDFYHFYERISEYFTNPYIQVAVLDVAIQWVCWIIAATLQTEMFYDLFGSATFVFLAWHTLRAGGFVHDRQLIQTGCVTVWGLRLGIFLFTRILHDTKDRRFDKVRGNPGIFFIYWTIQAVWIFITLLPTIILNYKEENPEISWQDYFGWGLWVIGFLLEAVADYQKSSFNKDPANKGKWIESGVWSISRHPNYLGEILLWVGLFLPAASVMEGKEFASAVSPLFVTVLLTKVSGIPLLERSATKRWGGNSDFIKYRRKTAILVPYIW